MALLRADQLTWSHALARMMLDDAHLAGMLELHAVPREDPNVADVEPWVSVPVPRWRVVIGRALALDQVPDVGEVVRAALSPFWGLRSSTAIMNEIRRSMTAALVMMDPNIVDVEVATSMNAVDPEEIKIVVLTKTAAAPGMVSIAPGAEDVQIPADIMTRPRGQA